VHSVASPKAKKAKKAKRRPPLFDFGGHLWGVAAGEEKSSVFGAYVAESNTRDSALLSQILEKQHLRKFLARFTKPNSR
jgi:hypothetical protein